MYKLNFKFKGQENENKEVFDNLEELCEFINGFLEMEQEMECIHIKGKSDTEKAS